mmetsp:Transcript_61285/g.198256  ORF Transcript_61285/g.198256 Transcript_61285/m.198256 type:complete len:220 (-) Transcript_61285:340-999(-)
MCPSQSPARSKPCCWLRSGARWRPHTPHLQMPAIASLRRHPLRRQQRSLREGPHAHSPVVGGSSRRSSSGRKAAGHSAPLQRRQKASRLGRMVAATRVNFSMAGPMVKVSLSGRTKALMRALGRRAKPTATVSLCIRMAAYSQANGMPMFKTATAARSKPTVSNTRVSSRVVPGAAWANLPMSTDQITQGASWVVHSMAKVLILGLTAASTTGSGNRTD